MARLPSAALNTTGASGSMNSASTWRQAPHGGLGRPFRLATATAAMRISRPELGNRPHHRRALGANRKPETHIFHVGSGHDLAAGQPQCRAHTEIGIRRIRVPGGLLGQLEESFERRLGLVRHIDAPILKMERRLEANPFRFRCIDRKWRYRNPARANAWAGSRRGRLMQRQVDRNEERDRLPLQLS